MLNAKEIGRALVVTPPSALDSFVATAGTTTAVLTIATMGSQVQSLGNSNSIVVGPFGAELSIENDGAATLYIAFASTSAAAGAMSPSATGTNATGNAYAIPANSERRFRIRAGLDTYLGYATASGSTTIRAMVTSDQGEAGAGYNTASVASPPTVTAVAPNIGSAAGGWPVVITGTNFITGATVTIGGSSATSVVVVSSTQITCNAPAYSGGANGSTSAQTVSVTTSGGTGSYSGVSPNGYYYYLPSNTAFAFAHQSNYGVTSSGGNVSAWADISGNGANWTGTNNPTLGTGFNGTSFPYIATDGSSSHLDLTLPGGGTASGQGSMFLVGQQTAQPGVDQSIFCFNGSSLFRSFRDYFAGAYYISDLEFISFQVAGTPDLNAHTYGFAINSSGAGTGYLDSVTGTGTITVGAMTTASIGWINTAMDYCAVRTMLDVGYKDTVSSGDATTIMTILMTLGAT
jgi:hypothetical protein